MVKNPKAKGNNFEREIAKLLTQWSGHEFHRTPSSGALHWPNDHRVVSDIVPSEELNDIGWPFSIECKNVNHDANIFAIIRGTSLFWEHWNQAAMDAKDEDKFPVLIFKKNNVKPHVAIERYTYNYYFAVYHIDSMISIYRNGVDLVVFPLASILSQPFSHLERLLSVDDTLA